MCLVCMNVRRCCLSLSDREWPLPVSAGSRCSTIITPGTHPGFLRALDSLDQSQQEQVLYVHRLKEERLRNVDEMFVAEMQAVEDDYQQQAEDIRDKMMEELISKTNEKGERRRGDEMSGCEVRVVCVLALAVLMSSCCVWCPQAKLAIW